VKNTPAKPVRDVILVGGSQGSIAAIRVLLAGLPPELKAAVAITIHRSPTFASSLAQTFASRSPLPVVEPSNGQRFAEGFVYLAPPDHHMVLRHDAMWLDRGPRRHFSRPAIDVMFASGAEEYGTRVIGVLLTGNLSDGVAGLVAIKDHGGLSLVQDPDEAEAPSMPLNAVAYDDVDVIFPMASSSGLLTKLVSGMALEEVRSSDEAVRPASRSRFASKSRLAFKNR
jgi:two-component system chemotaxis response regulator CheB